MEIVYLLIPISLVLIGLVIAAFLWAIKSEQFDDLEGPAHQILMDNDKLQTKETTSPKKKGAD